MVNEYNAHGPNHGTVFFGEEVLHQADATITSTLISPAHQHFAYVFHVSNAVPDYTMYAKLADLPEPTESARGYSPTVPAGWVE